MNFEEGNRKFLEEDIINNYQQFFNEFEKKIIKDNLLFSKSSDHVHLYAIDENNENLNFLLRVTVKKGLCSKVIVRNTEIPSAGLNWILNQKNFKKFY